MSDIKSRIRETYGRIAEKNSGESSCGCGSGCCGTIESSRSASVLGYESNELSGLPEGADMGLGCGNPTAIASLKPGETVLDLGSGGGIDCFLAAEKVGETGRVIGVDMTAQMIDKARANAEKSRFDNVEFRLGEIENLPLGDNTVDAVISNCVINLVPQKEKVFAEIRRVLKPGGRFMISDIVTTKDLPDEILKSVSAWTGCIAGAENKDRYMELLKQTGFENVEIVDSTSAVPEYWLSSPDIASMVKEAGISDEEARSVASSIVSARIRGYNPL